MSARVEITEYGRGASAALAQEIVDAKAGAPLAPVTVIVPSNFAGLAARRMLGSGSLGVAGVANVNFVTPFRLAELLAVGELQGRKPLTNPVLGAAVRRALAENPQHFRSVRDHHSTERALASAVGELSNVSSAGLEAIEQQGGHAASIISLYRTVKSHLRGFHDEADVARAAAFRTDLASALTPLGHLIWHLPGPVSAPLASCLRSVLSVAPASVIVATAGDAAIDAEVARTMRIAGIEMPATDGVLSSPPVADHIISVTDADEEVRAVIREVIQLVASGVALDRIGIFHPVPDPYVRILEQQFAAAQIPANGPSRRRLSESIAGRVLLAALLLPNERWRRDRVIALVNSGPLRHGEQSARPTVWDTISRSTGVVGGLADWRAKLEVERQRIAVAHQEASDSGNASRIDRLVDHRADVDDLGAFIDTLAAAVAAVDKADGWQARSEAAAALLHLLLGASQLRNWWPEDEKDAFEAVESALERLATLDEIDPSPTMAVFVRALSSELSVARGRSGRYGNGVVYGPLSSSPGHDLDAVFILGCTEGLCPTPRREDVLLPDRARKLTGGDLPQRLGQIDEQHRLFLAAVASAPIGKRWLFLPRGDLRSSRRSRPSRWLLPTASALANKQLYATDFEHDSPDDVYEVRSHAHALIQASHFTSVEERDVAQVYAYVRDGGEASAHPASELVARGLHAQAARRGGSFTEFDGHVTGVPVRSSGDTSQSASRLETWATCGFRYFLNSVLGLAERDDPEHTIELSALDRGSAMHTVLEQFMREQVAAGPPAPDEPWTDAQRSRAQEIAHDVFAEYERRGRTGRPIEWETQKSDLLALLDEFLSADDVHRSATRSTPAQFELPFGMRGASPLTLSLDDGRMLQFKGMIDRVDNGPDGSRFVSDYKTGKGKDYKDLHKDDPTKSGTMLQLGLYAEAVAQQLGGSSIGTHYWMVNTEVAHARYGYQWTPDHRERLADVLTTIADGIQAGVFAAVPGDWQSFRSSYDNCAYCDFDRVCPQGRAEQATDKADAPELQVRVDLTLKPASESAL